MSINIGAEVELLNAPLSNQFGRIKSIQSITVEKKVEVFVTVILYSGEKVLINIEKSNLERRLCVTKNKKKK